ncbi:MAG: glycosyltransferase family 4 protein [Pseudomonadota bacterium]
MKVTFLHPHGHGQLAGGFRVITEYADYLGRQGHEVFTVSPPREREPRFKGPLRRLPLRRDPFQDDSFVRGRSFTNIVSGSPHMLTPDDVPDADVIIATWWLTAEWIAGMPPEKGRRVHFIQDLEIFPYLPQERARAVLRDPMPKICVASWLEDALRKDFGADDITTVFNGTNLDAFPGGATDANRSGVGCLFARAPRKRFVLARDAVKEARARSGTDIPFKGFGAYPVTTNEGYDQYQESPPQDELAKIYGRCRAWLFSSESEGFGLPILEAMAMGTPVIATRAGAAPDLVNERNGRLVDSTPEAMAEAILELTTMSENEWSAMSEAARKTAELHSAENAAASFAKALERVAAGEPLRPSGQPHHSD